MSRDPNSALPEGVIEHFEIPGALRDVSPLGSGHIHDTFVASLDHAGSVTRYVLQRLNGDVFPDLAAVMTNLERICDHVRSEWQARGSQDAERRSLRLIPAREGGFAHVDSVGRWWRAFPFQEGTRSVDVLESPVQAFETARAFGVFAVQLSRLPGPPLAETLPHFSDAARRFADFDQAIANDASKRAAGVAREIDAAFRARDALAEARRSRDLGALPRRTVHNDCKINNLLLDADTGEGLCIVDLDTVMEGDIACDFGQLVRTGATLTREDEPDLTRVQVNSARLDALTRGYLAGTGPLLGVLERRALALAGPASALENAVRFLGDYLDGDRYFRIQRPDQNLDRARAQLELTTQLLDAAERVETQVAKHARGSDHARPPEREAL